MMQALNNVCDLLFLKLIEPRVRDKTIDLIEYNYDDIDKKMLKCCLFSELSKIKENDLYYTIEYIWKYVLWEHPKTRPIFDRRFFDFKGQRTFKLLINEINKIDFELIDSDIKGQAYEHFINEENGSSKLGQFFTPRNIIRVIINKIKPKIFDDGTTETILDPSAGTMGFLTEAYKYLKQQAINKQKKDEKFRLNINFLLNNTLNGIEANKDTQRLGLVNILLTTNNFYRNIKKGDSIRNILTDKYFNGRKFDIVLANPPFGIDGMNYNDLTENRSEMKKYLPIKSNSAIPLFIQAIIYSLKDNARAAIICPFGKEIFGKTKQYIELRKYLMETCNLTEVMMLPSKSFQYTGVETLVLFFKKGEITKKVKFTECNGEDSKEVVLAEADIKEIKENKWSLNYKEYVKVEEIKFSRDDIKNMKLQDICEIISGKKRKVSEENKNGKYEFYTCSVFGHTYIDHADYNQEGLIINAINGSGKCNIYYSKQYSTTSNNIHFRVRKNKIDICSNIYLHNYFKNNLDILKKGFHGTNQKKITINYLNNIKIPVPPLTLQNKIVHKLNHIYKSIELNKQQITTLEEQKKIIMQTVPNQYLCKEDELGELCDIKYGTRIIKNKSTKGEYPVYGGGRITFYINKYNRENNTLVVSRFGISENCVRLLKGKLFLNDSGMSLESKNKNLNQSYLSYYLLSKQNEIYNVSRGAAQKNINMKLFNKLPVHYPSLEIQKQIITQLEQIDTLINQLNQNIKSSEQLAKTVLETSLNPIRFQQETDRSGRKSTNVEDNKKKMAESDSESDTESEEDIEELKEELKEKKKTYKKLRKTADRKSEKYKKLKKDIINLKYQIKQLED